MSTLLHWLPLLLVALLANACAPTSHSQVDPFQALRQPDGSVLWLGEYRFVPPPKSWQVIDLDDKDSSLAFYKSCQELRPGNSPCESTMAFAEEPFGHSRELEARAHEFLQRFLWASRVRFSAPVLAATKMDGREALAVNVTGEEPVKHYKVQAKIVFMHRGERVVAFFLTQWRAAGAPRSEQDFADFDRFVASFRFVKPSFYETL